MCRKKGTHYKFQLSLLSLPSTIFFSFSLFFPSRFPLIATFHSWIIGWGWGGVCLHIFNHTFSSMRRWPHVFHHIPHGSSTVLLPYIEPFSLSLFNNALKHMLLSNGKKKQFSAASLFSRENLSKQQCVISKSKKLYIIPTLASLIKQK